MSSPGNAWPFVWCAHQQFRCHRDQGRRDPSPRVSPEHSHHGTEMTAKVVRNWKPCRQNASSGASPWENGYCESFNGKLREECFNQELFYSLKEAQVAIEQWRKHDTSALSARLSTTATTAFTAQLLQRISWLPCSNLNPQGPKYLLNHPQYSRILSSSPRSSG